MDGYIGAPEGRREMADLVIQADGKDYRFQVTNALLLSGHGLPSSLFAAVSVPSATTIIPACSELPMFMPPS